MTFREYYKNLKDVKQKRAFRKKIMDATKTEPGTFYTWINRNNASELAKKVIAELLKKEQKELFPEKENELLTN